MSGPGYYDGVYTRSESYRGPPEESSYYPVWKAVLNLIREPMKILDIGCGPGQFAELCVKAGHEYLGLDYSPEAIGLGVDKGFGDFCLVDMEEDHSHLRGNYQVATFIEFLEHVNGDLSILGDVPPGREIILTVPNYPGREHFRFFENLDEVVERYGPFINITTKMIFTGYNPNYNPEIYLLKGVKRRGRGWDPALNTREPLSRVQISPPTTQKLGI